MLLNVENLSVDYGTVPAARNVSFAVGAGEAVGIVGESGSGKSTVLRSIVGLLDASGRIRGGKVCFEGQNLLRMPPNRLRQIRGRDIAVIFQHPELSMDPLQKIEDACYESVRLHRDAATRMEVREKTLAVLSELNFCNAERIAAAYPFELSGGMCQRVTIGMALLNEPRLLLADELTSALDVHSQLQIVELLLKIKEKYRTSLLFVTHNMGLVGRMADQIGVMLDGQLVEFGTRDEVLLQPMHAYTKALIASVPKMDCSLPPLVKYDRGSGANGEKVWLSDSHWYLRPV